MRFAANPDSEGRHGEGAPEIMTLASTMNSNQEHDLADDDIAPIVDFGRRNPLEIGVSLRNLANRGDFLTAQYGYGNANTFTFDWGGVPEQNSLVLASQKLIFHSSPDGVRVEFTTGAARQTSFEGRPAFEADFPPVLYYMQRREYFRVEAPVLDPYICSGMLP